jgi:hypothetical protein
MADGLFTCATLLLAAGVPSKVVQSVSAAGKLRRPLEAYAHELPDGRTRDAKSLRQTGMSLRLDLGPIRITVTSPSGRAHRDQRVTDRRGIVKSAPTTNASGFVVDMKGSARRTGGHRHCVPAIVSEPPFLGDNSSHERFGPQSAPIGVEEHHKEASYETHH